MNKVTVFPMALAASSFLSAPIARLMVTVANLNLITVVMSMFFCGM